MGASCDSKGKKNTIISAGEIGTKDKSYVISVIQVLYNIPNFKKYFTQNEFKENPNKYLSILFKKIVSTPLKNLDFEKEANEILQILRNKYGLNTGYTPGDILIQILLVLKYEEKQIQTKNWEEYAFNTPNIYNNLSNSMQAFNDILNFNQEHYNTTFSAMFFGIFYAKRKLQKIQNILYIYNFFCVYELNMPMIYQNMISKGKIKYNESQLPQIGLIDCIKELQETQNELFKNENSLVEYYIFHPPTFLIFLLKSDTPNFDSFRGIITFQEYMNFSQVIQNSNSFNFKLISVINKDRYKSKEKQNKGGVWMSNPDDDKRPYYKAIFRGEQDKFYCCDKNSVKNCELNINDIEYYHYILIFMKN